MIKKHSARFTFSATGVASRFQCALVRKNKHRRASFKRCASPKAYSHLKVGEYTFEARAVGPGGTDKTPAKKRFRIH